MNTLTIDELNIFSKMSFRIIREQENIVGPIAWNEAEKVQGLHVVDKIKGEFTFDGDAREVLNKLVIQYEKLFGKLAHSVCREVTRDLIAELPADDVPSSLK